MIAWFDCFSGTSGDKILGALVDSGWPADKLHGLPASLGLDEVEVTCAATSRNGIRGMGIHVAANGTGPLRTLPVICNIISSASIPEKVRKNSIRIFGILAEAEAQIHDCPVDHVHFHEAGAVDTIIDIVGTVQALNDLDIRTCCCSPLPMGRGFVQCSHGTLPLPAPAVSKILKGIPVYGTDIDAELVTPTGAAIMKGICTEFSSMPAMTLEKTGYGAGTAEFADIPNLLRVWIGKDENVSRSRLTRLSTCIDDMNPEWFPHVMDKLFDAGALDVFLRPVYMKKGRPGHELVVLSPSGMEENLRNIIFSETTTIGIRFTAEARHLLPRHAADLKTPWGMIRAKIIERPGGKQEIVPEYEECRKIAGENGVPLARVYREVEKLT